MALNSYTCSNCQHVLILLNYKLPAEKISVKFHVYVYIFASQDLNRGWIQNACGNNEFYKRIDQLQ